MSDSQQTEEKRALINCILESHPRSAERFLPLLADDDPFVRQWTIEAVMKLRTHDTAQFIAPLINDLDSMVRVDAIEAIGLLHYASASAQVVERLQHDTDSLARICAAEALGELGVRGEHEIAALFTAMEQDHNELVRAYAAESLGRLGFTSARARIAAHFGVERSPRVRASMLLALYRLGDDDALGSLLRMLGRVRRWEMEAAILNMLREIVSPANRDEIERAIRKVAKRKPAFVTDHRLALDLFASGIAYGKSRRDVLSEK